jgi:phosphoglycerate dehydrogenase-like enzyme
VKKALGIYGPETEGIKEKFNILKILFGSQYTTKFINSNLPLPSQIELLKDLSVIIAMPSTFPNELAEKCKNLKLIQVFSAGTDNIDIQYLAKHGIQIANNFGQNAVTVAEHTIGLMISVSRNFHAQITETFSGNWQSNVRGKLQNSELFGKKIGIIGFGEIGQKVAQRLQGWECELSYNDILKIPEEIKEKFNIQEKSKEDIFLNSDIITLHVPLTAMTIKLAGEKELNMMKKSSILINASRGPVVDEKALYKILKNRKIMGAGLDVLEDEPNIHENHPLLSLKNVFITPHLAALSSEAGDRTDKFMVNNVKRFLDGDIPLSIIN